MRRLLVFCAVAVAVCTAFVWAQSDSSTMDPVAALAKLNAAHSSAGAAAPLPANATLVADGVYGRALAIRSDNNALLTAAETPNRLLVALAAGGLQSSGAGAMAASFTAAAGTGKAGFGGDGGAATSAQLALTTAALSKRSGVAVALDGTIFVADTSNSTIRMIAGPQSSEPGIIRSVAGRWAARQNVTLTEPMGIAVDRAGDLFIADHAAGAVYFLRAGNGELRTLAHVISPASIAVKLDGSEVFVASPATGGVFSINPATQAIETVKGFAPVTASPDAPNAGPCAALEGSAEASGAVAPGATTSKQVCPAGLAVDAQGNLFVADANGGKILRVDAKTNQTNAAASGLNAPGDIAFDTKGDLFVADQGNDRILVIAQVGGGTGSLSITAPAPPAACPQGAVFTFCNQPTAGQSTPFAFTLTNTSAATVTGVTIGFIPVGTPGNFTQTSSSCEQTLAANSSCVIDVAFTPQSTGLLAGSLTVIDSNPGDLATQLLAGTGDDFSLQIVAGASPEVTVAQGSTATFMAQLTSASGFGANGEKITLICPTNLPAFTSCAFTPCPVTPTVDGTTPFSIVIGTSSLTFAAPQVPIACGAPAASVRKSHAAIPMWRSATERLNRSPRFPALLAILVAVFLVLLRRRSAIRINPRLGVSPVALRWVRATLALAMISGAFLTGCHGAKLADTSTPVGTYTLNVTANAVDANGNPLNASRAMQIKLDVIKQIVTPIP